MGNVYLPGNQMYAIVGCSPDGLDDLRVFFTSSCDIECKYAYYALVEYLGWDYRDLRIEYVSDLIPRVQATIKKIPKNIYKKLEPYWPEDIA